jgi:hypothetical protein
MNTITKHTKLKQNNIFIILFELIICKLTLIYERMLKIFLRLVTRLTELERICQYEKIESIRIKKIGLL